MATKDPDSGGGFPVNFTTLLAILTVAGGVLSGAGGRQLSSRRPVAPAGISQQGGGNQSADDARQRVDEAKEMEEAARRVAKDLGTKAAFDYGTDLPAAELAAKNLDEASKRHLETVEKHKIAVERAKTGSEDRAWISYEWYRTKTFFPRKGDSDPERRVLLMWINELDFGQVPLMKLDLLLRPLLGDGPKDWPLVEAALIGPRTSDTLRDMVGGDFAPKSSVTPDPSVKDVIGKRSDGCRCFSPRRTRWMKSWCRLTVQ